MNEGVSRSTTLRKTYYRAARVSAKPKSFMDGMLQSSVNFGGISTAGKTSLTPKLEKKAAVHQDLQYHPRVNFTLPKHEDTWEYDRASTASLEKEQRYPARKVNRYVGGGGWIKPPPEVSKNILLNDDGLAWVPYDCKGEDWCKDGVKKMDHEVACEHMQQLGFSRILVLGESLERHFFQALAVIFSGDYVAGSLKEDLAPDVLERCSGDMQFSEKKCRPVGTHDKVTCGGNLTLRMREAFNIKFADYGIKAARNDGSKRSDLLVAGVGLHDNMLFPRSVVNGYLRKMLQALRANKAQSTFVWFSVHAINSRQQPQYRRTQNLKAIYNYNRYLEAACCKEGVDFINSYLLTMGQHSYDGVHFEAKINLIRGTLFLWQYFRGGVVRPLTNG